MEGRPLISVVLPAYNADRYLAQAVQSVLSQVYTTWELIIVNDGSTDGTRAYLESLADKRIHVIHQQNKGVSAARNAALAVATGEYVTFLDADDVLPPESLGARGTYLQTHPDVDIVDGVISVRNEALSAELRRYQPNYQGPLLRRLLSLDDRVFFGPFYMLRRSCIGNFGFSNDMTHAEDLLFFMTLASHMGLNYGFVNQLVYLYRKSSESAMSNMAGLERGYLQLLHSVHSLPGVALIDFEFLRLKIAKILLLSWVARGEKTRAILSLLRTFRKN